MFVEESIPVSGDAIVRYDPEEVSLLSQLSDESCRSYTKIQVKPDKRGFLDLSSMFSGVSVVILERVWKSNNESWDACFDVLKAWQASHGQLLISTEQLEFVFDAEEWPVLPSFFQSSIPQTIPNLTARLAHISLARTSVHGNSSGTSDGWSFCEDLSETDNDTESFSDGGESWVKVQDFETSNSECETDASPTSHTISQRSFKDILLSQPSTRGVTNKRPRSGSDSYSGVEKRRAWKPQIVCVNVKSRRHVNVVYMDSDCMLDSPSWDQTFDDDDDSYCTGYGCGGVSTKSFAASALSNAFRIRSAVIHGKNINAKALRCKF